MALIFGSILHKLQLVQLSFFVVYNLPNASIEVLSDTGHRCESWCPGLTQPSEQLRNTGE
jgi:hypothetical protein